MSDIEIPARQLFRPDEVARIMRVIRRTVYNWIQESRLDFIKTPGGQYRIPRGEILRMMEMKRDD